MNYSELNKITLEDGREVDGIRVSTWDKKTAVLRFPTAKEQEDYYAALATNTSSDDEPSFKADLDLFNKLRLDSGEAWDEYEARYIISRYISVDLFEQTESGDEQVVTLKTQFGFQTHHLRTPSVKEMILYERAMSKPRTKAVNAPVHKLYNGLVIKTEGYPASFTNDDIPADHKQLCINSIRASLVKIDPFESKNE